MATKVIGKTEIDGEVYKIYGPKKSHPYIKVLVGDYTIQLDVKIALLILSLWKKGIVTLNCCQGDDDGHNGYIQFLPKDAYKLLPWIDDGDFDVGHRCAEWSTVSIKGVPKLRDTPREAPTSQEWFQAHLEAIEAIKEGTKNVEGFLAQHVRTVIHYADGKLSLEKVQMRA
jgi:hypothetical protein